MPHKPSFLQYSFNSVFNFALIVLLDVGTNFRPLDKREISASERFLFERLITLLLTNLRYCYIIYYVAILFIFPLSCFSWISDVFSALLIISFSLTSGLTKSQTRLCICVYRCMYIFFVRSPHHKHFGKAQHLVLWALWWHQLFSTR